ncbi:MAG: hypothetical protein Fur0036_18320 [Fimbriimonadaceae bacterium]
MIILKDEPATREDMLALFLEPDEVYSLIMHCCRLLRSSEYQECKISDGTSTLVLSGIHPGNASQAPAYLVDMVEKYFAERFPPAETAGN